MAKSRLFTLPRHAWISGYVDIYAEQQQNYADYGLD